MELSRIALGFIAAVAVPMSVPWLRESVVRTTITCSSYIAYVALPALPAARAISFGLLACLTGLFLCRRRLAQPTFVNSAGTTEISEKAKAGYLRLRASARKVPNLHRNLLARFDTIVFIALLGGSIALMSGLYREGSLTNLISDDHVAIVLSAALLAVFAGNELVLVAVAPQLRELAREGEELGKIVPTGLHIGWIERMIVFSFIAGGEPAAAALAVAAKSVIRIPEVNKHAGVFGQYVVVGTLSNLLVGLCAAVIARILIGLPPL